MFIIVEGNIMIQKLVKYYIEEDSQTAIKTRKLHDIIEITDGELVGEDNLWFERPNSYSAKVISNTAQLLKIDILLFKKFFSKLVPLMDEFFRIRSKFIKKRCNAHKF